MKYLLAKAIGQKDIYIFYEEKESENAKDKKLNEDVKPKEKLKVFKYNTMKAHRHQMIIRKVRRIKEEKGSKPTMKSVQTPSSSSSEAERELDCRNREKRKRKDSYSCRRSPSREEGKVDLASNRGSTSRSRSKSRSSVESNTESDEIEKVQHPMRKHKRRLPTSSSSEAEREPD